MIGWIQVLLRRGGGGESYVELEAAQEAFDPEEEIRKRGVHPLFFQAAIGGNTNVRPCLRACSTDHCRSFN
jgi:hypothetical protein